MTMEEEETIIRDALRLIAAAGTSGVLKSKLMLAVRKLDGTFLSPEQQTVIWGILTGRNWIVGHVEPIWHNTRWCLTSKGAEALESLS